MPHKDAKKNRSYQTLWGLARQARGLCRCGRSLEGFKTCPRCLDKKRPTRKAYREREKSDPRLKELARQRRVRRKGHFHNLIKDRLSLYKSDAKKRGRVWALPDGLALDLLTDTCYYCGDSPSPLNGIDRVNSALGYLEDNVVAACAFCNRMKLDLPQDEFYRRCHRIAARWLNYTTVLLRAKQATDLVA
jgi:hypothetical protein